MPDEELKDLIRRVNQLEQEVVLKSSTEFKQLVTRGVKWRLSSANSANPGHTHTGASISALDTGDITTGILALARGGTNKSVTASNGAVVYSDADSFELSAVGTAGQRLRSAGAGAPSWISTGLRFGGSNTQTSIGNTTAITQFSSTSIPANTMGTNGIIRVTMGIDIDSNIDTSEIFVQFTSLGGTTFCDIQTPVGTNTQILVTVTIANRNATGSQIGWGWGLQANGTFRTPVGGVIQTLAIDTASVQTILTGGRKNNGANNKYNHEFTFVEILE